MKFVQGTALFLALGCLSLGVASAQGEPSVSDHWVEVGSQKGITRYVAASALIRQDDYAVIWRLQNYDAAQIIDSKPVRSVKYQVEYNCASHQRRGLYYEMYSGSMGSGSLVGLSYDTGHWRAIALDTSHGYQVACGGIAHPAVVASAP